MIAYITLGTNDIEKSRQFYDGLLAEIGASRISDSKHLTIWGSKQDGAVLGLIKPFNREPATTANGSMVAFSLESKEKVSALHARALELGGTDDGPPGPRGTRGNEFAYCRDPEGHKLAFFHQA